MITAVIVCSRYATQHHWTALQSLIKKVSSILLIDFLVESKSTLRSVKIYSFFFFLIQAKCDCLFTED